MREPVQLASFFMAVYEKWCSGAYVWGSGLLVMTRYLDRIPPSALF
jgi:hypothetical protein